MILDSALHPLSLSRRYLFELITNLIFHKRVRTDEFCNRACAYSSMFQGPNGSTGVWFRTGDGLDGAAESSGQILVGRRMARTWAQIANKQRAARSWWSLPVYLCTLCSAVPLAHGGGAVGTFWKTGQCFQIFLWKLLLCLSCCFER